MHGAILARTADTMTLARALLAAALAGAVAAERVSIAAWLLVAAWCSDAADGRLARAGRQPTRLGRHDLVIDTAVGVGLLVGRALSGHVPPTSRRSGGATPMDSSVQDTRRTTGVRSWAAAAILP